MVYEFLTIIFFSLCIEFSHETITLNHAPLPLSNVTGHSYQFMYVGESKLANVTGQLVVANPIYACNWEEIKNKYDFESNIVLVRRGHCSPADKFRTVQKGSGRAIVILVEKDEYLHLAGSYFLHTKGITIPGYEYRPESQSTYDQLVKLEGAPNTTVEVEIVGEPPIIDQNYYLAFSIVQGTFSLVNVFLAYRKIKQLYKAQEINRTLPQITLAIEILTNILRVILCLEPEYGLGRGLIEFGTLGFLQSGTLPWSLVPTLIIAFYWDNAIENWETYMKKSWKVLPFKRCKFPLAAISSLIVFGDLVSGVIRAMYYGNKWMAGIILYLSAAVVLIIAIIFTLNGARALYFMWAKCEEANPRHRQAMRRMTSFVCGNCCGIYVVVAFLLVMPPPIEHGWKIGYFGAAFALNFVSLMQIMVFDPETIFQLAVMEKENETAKCTPSASIELQNATTSNNAINV